MESNANHIFPEVYLTRTVNQRFIFNVINIVIYMYKPENYNLRITEYFLGTFQEWMDKDKDKIGILGFS